jgi:hypothetical protein
VPPGPDPPKPDPPKPEPPGPDPVPPEPEVKPVCTEGLKEIADAGFDKDPVAIINVKEVDLKDSREYGFGFWFRYMTRYPSALLNGKREPWYHLARLASNDPYKDLQLGDRNLAVF